MQASYAHNKSNKRCRAMLQGLGLGLSALLSAAPLALGSVELDARPKVCVSLEAESSCEMEVAVHWRSRKADNYCLRVKHSGEVLECWQAATEGDYDFSFRHQGELVLQLFVLGQEGSLREQRLISVSREVRDLRRRRRHVWSLF